MINLIGFEILRNGGSQPFIQSLEYYYVRETSFRMVEKGNPLVCTDRYVSTFPPVLILPRKPSPIAEVVGAQTMIFMCPPRTLASFAAGPSNRRCRCLG